MKIIFVRQEDYWIFPLSFFGVLFTGLMLYVGTIRLRLPSGGLGIGILLFGTYTIRRHYGWRLAARYLAICLVSALLLAWGAYALTN